MYDSNFKTLSPVCVKCYDYFSKEIFVGVLADEDNIVRSVTGEIIPTKFSNMYCDQPRYIITSQFSVGFDNLFSYLMNNSDNKLSLDKNDKSVISRYYPDEFRDRDVKRALNESVSLYNKETIKQNAKCSQRNEMR